jgi:hypothetical protein
MSRHEHDSLKKPLLSIEETAILLGESRSSLYRSVERGDLPLPLFTINGRLRVAREAVDRLLAGERRWSVEMGQSRAAMPASEASEPLTAPVANSAPARMEVAGRPRPVWERWIFSAKKLSNVVSCPASSSGTPSV